MKMINNYFYLIAGFLCILFAITHTLNGLSTALSDLNNSSLDSDTKTTFIYIWHIIGVENLIFGIALILLTFQKNLEKVKYIAWLIIVILVFRWVIISYFTLINDMNGIVNLLPDTIAIFILSALLFFGSRTKRLIKPD